MTFLTLDLLVYLSEVRNHDINIGRIYFSGTINVPRELESRRGRGLSKGGNHRINVGGIHFARSICITVG